MDWNGNDDPDTPNNRPRKRLRKRKRPRKHRRKRPDPDDGANGRETPERGVEVVEVGSGDFCTMTIPRDGGPMVVHRHETAEAAQKQHRKNVEADAPLAGLEDPN